MTVALPVPGVSGLAGSARGRNSAITLEVVVAEEEDKDESTFFGKKNLREV